MLSFEPQWLKPIGEIRRTDWIRHVHVACAIFYRTLHDAHNGTLVSPPETLVPLTGTRNADAAAFLFHILAVCLQYRFVC